jgi:hypothetical protein
VNGFFRLPCERCAHLKLAFTRSEPDQQQTDAARPNLDATIAISKTGLW